MPEWLKNISSSLLPKLGLSRAFDSQDPTLEVNLLAYGFGVAIFAFWLSWWAIHGERDGNFVAALGVFAGMVTGGLFKKGSISTPATKTPGMPDEGRDR